MTLMPHSIFEHYIEQRFQVNFRRIRVPAYLVCPDGRTSRDAVIRPDVRCGSKTDLTAPKSNFRSTPESGLKSDISPCPLSAAITGNPVGVRRTMKYVTDRVNEV